MELVPPVGWADVGTKRDLDLVGSGFRVEMHQRFESIQRDLRLQLYWLIGTVVSAVGAAATVAQLT